MQPASVDFLIRGGDSEAPKVGLRTEEPATFERGNLLGPGDVAHWILTVGSDDRTKTSEPDGGLVQDTDDPGLFSYPLAATGDPSPRRRRLPVPHPCGA